MASNLKKALEIIATTSGSDVAKGNAFEKLTKIFLNDPAYPLKLFQRVITVSLETMKIVNNLPALGI
jgi:predicted helicase